VVFEANTFFFWSARSYDRLLVHWGGGGYVMPVPGIWTFIKKLLCTRATECSMIDLYITSSTPFSLASGQSQIPCVGGV